MPFFFWLPLIIVEGMARVACAEPQVRRVDDKSDHESR
jgi:hypothetical protein